PERQIIIRHVAGDVGIAGLGAWLGPVVIANGDVEESRQLALVGGSVFLQIFHEPIDAGDVGAIGVVGREIKAGGVVEFFWHLIVDASKCAGASLGLTFVVVRQLVAFAIVAERDAAAREVLPERPIFQVILGNLRSIRTE